MGIKSKYSECIKCPLISQKMVKADTNCKSPEEVEIMIFAEAPSHKEIEENKPLVGKAGAIFRNAFQESGLDTLKYYITNVVLCSNIIDEKTQNPPDIAVELCKPNYKKLLEISKPKLIVLLGTTAMNSFGLGNKGILKDRGTFKSYNGIPVMVCLHPSYVLRNGGIKGPAYKDFLEDFKKAFLFIMNDELKKNINEENINDTVNIKREDGLCSYILPNWCYSNDVKLVDIQHIRQTDEILYIFRNSKNEKIYYRFPGNDRYHYTLSSMSPSEAPHLISSKKVQIHVDKRKYYGKVKQTAVYESDVKLHLKHSIDYRYNRGKMDVAEFISDPKILFFDIEVYNHGDLNFPDADVAPSPINAISWFTKDSNTVNLILANILDKNWSGIENIMDISGIPVNIKIVKTEEELLNKFCSVLKSVDPDIIAGWNTNGFDIITIYNRMRRLGLDPNNLSPVNQVFIDSKLEQTNIYGIYSLDMMRLYKKFSSGEEESYALDNICMKLLKKGKVKHEESLDTLFESKIMEFIDYSVTDTLRLKELDEKLGHINLMSEIVRICSSTWKECEKSTGQVDPLCILHAKNKGLVCKNSLYEKNDDEEESDDEESNNPGAYVRPPKSGLHKYVIDLDFTSLYPSIVRTFNIGPNTFIAKIEDHPDDRYHFSNDDKTYYFNKTAFDWIYNRDELKNKKIKIIINPLSTAGKQYSVSLEQFDDFIKRNKAIVSTCGTIFKGQSSEMSFFGELLEYLMKSRVEYKNLMKKYGKEKNSEKEKIMDCIQLAYKILANSVYGVLYCPNFRFFNIDMAKTITLTGQELVKYSGYHLGNYMKNKDTSIHSDIFEKYDEIPIPYLIYQDTDSLFIEMGEYLNEQL